MTAATVVAVALGAVAVPYALAALYLGALALVARRPAARSGARRGAVRFDVLVPAHDEEAGIAATVASLRAMTYPPGRFRVVVVADNCRDATAARAREAGALVIERHDPARRGKGHALAAGFAASLADGAADAIVVVDADTSVSPGLLDAFEAALDAGHDVLQADYGVRNPEASWRTRLVTLGLALFHGVRSLARERLGLSCGLRGNGMCFRAALLRRVPHRAVSLVEDLEFGIQLGLAGVRVAYVPEARVWGDMPASAAHARSQRERWEHGRRAIARRDVGPLLRAALHRRDAVPLDLALDLLVPPLGHLATAILLGGAAAATTAWLGAPVLPLALWALAAAGVLVYVLRGCAATGHPLRAAGDLAWVPLYLSWKLTLRAWRGGRGPEEWVRTARAASPTGVR